jgi:peptidoglycan/LPS O-acetylase OafA/YrhL
MEFIDVMEILGYWLRLLGAGVFGVAAGWLVLQAIKPETFHWALAATATIGLFLTFALIGHWVDGGGTMGAFGLGAGGAILIWPLAARSREKDTGPSRRRK